MTYVSKGNQFLSPVMGHYSQLEVESGKGSYLQGRDGKQYLDFAAGVAVASTGHCHPKVVVAIQRQVEKLIHAGAGVVYYGPNVNLAEKLAQLFGPHLTSTFFTQSGTEAVEGALKLARYASKRHGILAFKGGFHGRTFGALSVTSSKEKYRDGYHPLLEGVVEFPFPNCYRCPWGKEPTSCGTYCAKALEETMEKSPVPLGAAIIEPILGEGGYVPAPSEFLNKLRALCNGKDTLLIFDEIQSGMGRTGSWSYGQKLGIEPDILVLAKGIASGMPLGALMASPTLMSKWTTGAHGSTYGGNPVSCSAALATIEVLSPLLEKVAEKGQLLTEILRAQLENSSCVGDIRQVGLMVGIEFVTSKESKAPDADLVKAIMKKSLENGLLVISCGVFDNVIRLMPPLTVHPEELRKAAKILVTVIHECSR